MPLKALLVLDNAPSHPKEDEINFDPNFRVLFLPPNCTAILQPMDQNLIQNIKVAYRKQLLTHILLEDDKNIAAVLKKFNLRDAVYFLDSAWKGIGEKNIKKSWSILWPELASQWNNEDLIPLSQLRQQIDSDSSLADLNRIHAMIRIIDPNGDTSTYEINKWATGQNEVSYDFSDNDIIQSALQIQQNVTEAEEEDSEDENVNKEVSKISNNEARKIFAKGIQWAEQNNASQMDILLLKRLREKAEKMFLDKAFQPKINTCFPNL